jgi:ABC-type Fe3+/spermidine/putrescine transport system ATPase subunit
VVPNNQGADVPGEGYLLIRAERIKIGKKPSQTNYLIGEIEERFLMGSMVQYGVKVGDKTITVASTNLKGERYDGPLHEKVVLEWDEESGIFIR